MTVRHLFRRAWLAALLGSAAIATAQEPLPLPPLPGATPVAPPAESLPPLVPATGTVPSVPAPAGTPVAPPMAEAPKAAPVIPPPTATPPALPPLTAEVPKAAPVIPPPTATPATLPPLTAEVPKVAPVATPPVVAPAAPMLPVTPVAPAAPPMVAPMPPMAPMPTAAPVLPPMTLPGEVKATGAVAKIAAPPMGPMAPALPPSFETPAATKPALPSTSTVKVGKPAIDGLAAYSMMLAEAKIAYSKVNDYSGHVIHQDRVRGKLTPDQTAELRVKSKPASVSLKYVAPNALMGQELAHVAGRNGGKLRMKPAGSFGPAGFLTLDLADSRATAHTRHAAPEFGIGPMIDLLEKNLTIETRLRNAVQVSVSEYTYANRPVTRFEVYTDRAHALRFAYRTVVFVDRETKLPIRMEAYDQPTIGSSPSGELLESYSYVNLKFNQGLGEAIFDK